MFRIGDFSRLTRVSVKTLHHYDELGLFKPAQVDAWTGYRYYSFEQLPRLMHILALKELGFALEDIKHMLDTTLTPEQMQYLMRLRQNELEQEREALDAKLSRLAAYRQLIEQEGRMSTIQVILKPVEAVWIVGSRAVVPQTQMRDGCMALNDAALAYSKKHALTITPTSLALYHDSREDGVDVTMAYYAEAPHTVPAAEGQTQVYALPVVGTMATAIYHGSYDGFEQVRDVYTAVGKWIEANGYKMAGAIREIYLQPPDWSTTERIGVMELQFPVEKG